MSHPERRRSPRQPPERSHPTVRLGTGAPGHLIDVGVGGVAAEFPVQLLPGTDVRAQVIGTGWSTRVQVRVVWCHVARISGDGVTYRAGLAFATAMARLQG